MKAADYASRVTLPIHHGQELVGHFEAYTSAQRPWSRFQVGRARLISYPLGPLLDAEARTHQLTRP